MPINVATYTYRGFTVTIQRDVLGTPGAEFARFSATARNRAEGISCRSEHAYESLFGVKADIQRVIDLSLAMFAGVE